MKTKWSQKHMVKNLGNAQPRPYYFFLERSLKESNSILEVGTGPGRLLDFLRHKAKLNCEFTGADITSEMLEEVKENHPDIKTIETDVMNMTNIPDNSYDWVICSDVMIHIPEPYKALDELWRVTRGALLFIVRGSDYPQDIVDDHKSYQLLEGDRYFYNIFNHNKMKERVSNFDPKPKKINSLLLDMTAARKSRNRFVDIPENNKIYTSCYVVLKDESNINWILNRDFEFDERSFEYRLKRKIRGMLKNPTPWDKYKT